jgi:dimethylhistidine N-methyltransferase
MMENEISILELVEGLTEPSPSVIIARRDARADFAEAVLTGLARPPRSIPCRFFYDAAGSALFEEITALPEYYPTRVETELLITHGAEIARLAGGERVLVEFGSGSSRKTSLLIQALAGVRAYVPIDIAGESLAEAAEWLKEQHADVVIAPLIADFTTAVALPAIARRGPRLGFFSGSTIGNLTHAEAGAFLANAAQLLGQDSAFLIGVDLKKSPAILLPAYDDAKGVTAAFNLNLLVRINRELGGTFDLSRFAHEAVYDVGAGRIEMRLVSLADQTVRVAGQNLAFAAGERIHTENSHKYSVSQFQTLARGAGWTPIGAWTDQDQLFSLHLLRRA